MLKSISESDHCCKLIRAETVELVRENIEGETGEHKSKFYVSVMELLDFELTDKLKTYLFMDLNSVKKIVAQLIMALKCVHEAGFVHRDIKPDNIMFKITGKNKYLLKLIDFGLAGKIKKDSKIFVKVTPCGTISFMSRACMEGKE